MVPAGFVEQGQPAPDLEAQPPGFARAKRELGVECLQAFDGTARGTRALRPPSNTAGKDCTRMRRREHLGDHDSSSIHPRFRRLSDACYESITTADGCEIDFSFKR